MAISISPPAAPTAREAARMPPANPSAPESVPRKATARNAPSMYRLPCAMLISRSAPKTRVSPALTRNRSAAPESPETRTTTKVSRLIGIARRLGCPGRGHLVGREQEVGSRHRGNVGEGVEPDRGVGLEDALVLRGVDLVIDRTQGERAAGGLEGQPAQRLGHLAGVEAARLLDPFGPGGVSVVGHDRPVGGRNVVPALEVADELFHLRRLDGEEGRAAVGVDAGRRGRAQVAQGVDVEEAEELGAVRLAQQAGALGLVEEGDQVTRELGRVDDLRLVGLDLADVAGVVVGAWL